MVPAQVLSIVRVGRRVINRDDSNWPFGGVHDRLLDPSSVLSFSGELLEQPGTSPVCPVLGSCRYAPFHLTSSVHIAPYCSKTWAEAKVGEGATFFFTCARDRGSGAQGAAIAVCSRRGACRDDNRQAFTTGRRSGRTKSSSLRVRLWRPVPAPASGSAA